MKKTVLTVFAILGAVVIGFVAWNIVFADGGVIATGWNSVANAVNGAYSKVSGTTDLLPLYEQTKGKTTNKTVNGVSVDGSGGGGTNPSNP